MTKPLFHYSLKEGDLVYHKTYGVVKFVSTKDYVSYISVYTIKYKKVNGEKTTYWEWDKVMVCTHKLKEYNKKKHGFAPDYLK